LKISCLPSNHDVIIMSDVTPELPWRRKMPTNQRREVLIWSSTGIWPIRIYLATVFGC